MEQGRQARNSPVIYVMFLVSLWILPFAAAGAQPSIPKPSLWMDPVNAHRPNTTLPTEPSVNSSEVKLATTEKIEPAPLAQQEGRIAIIVESGIYDAISATLATYADDLAGMGFSTIVTAISGNAEYVRNGLKALYNEAGSLVGAVLIGEIPYVIYEMNQDWGNGTEYEDFACDIYFMDMDGEWLDELNDGQVQPNNGKLDTWVDNTGLEIWVSRMRTSNLASLGSETELLNSYFARNHALRSNLLNNTLTGLVYNDDDWENLADDDTSNLELLFDSGNVITVSAPESTTAGDYINQRLTANYHFDFIRSHGSPAGHGFYRNGHTNFDWVLTSDYVLSDPAAVFFSLYVCSGCDYATAGYLGGVTAFNPESNGLLALGTTKTGGMFLDNHMYNRIAAGDCIGESFKYWFNQVKDYSYAPRYWYGMVLIGDGSLASINIAPGDFHPDGQVDLYDFAIFSLAWRSRSGEPNWNRVCDVCEPKNVIDEGDLRVFAEYWLTAWRIPPLPARVSYIAPADGARNVDINYDLIWTDSAGATSYDVYFGTSNPPPFIRNQTATTFDPGTMAENTGHYWRIDAVNMWGATTGWVWRFTTGFGGPPP